MNKHTMIVKCANVGLVEHGNAANSIWLEKILVSDELGPQGAELAPKKRTLRKNIARYATDRRLTITQ